MTRIEDVAQWFLTKESMTHKKLQKLCYYAQAWYCALYDGTPLFRDEIQAWIHGPVTPSLYHKYSEFKWNSIPKIPLINLQFDEKTEMLLNAVYNTYGDFSGEQLETLTHSEDPWRIARKNLKPWEPSTNPINISDMRIYYGKKYDEGQCD